MGIYSLYLKRHHVPKATLIETAIVFSVNFLPSILLSPILNILIVSEVILKNANKFMFLLHLDGTSLPIMFQTQVLTGAHINVNEVKQRWEGRYAVRNGGGCGKLECTCLFQRKQRVLGSSQELLCLYGKVNLILLGLLGFRRKIWISFLIKPSTF